MDYENEEEEYLVEFLERGVILVQYPYKRTAKPVARKYNGKCFRGTTLRVHRVSDDEMEAIIEVNKAIKAAAAEKVGLFVCGLGRTFQDGQYIRKFFSPIFLTGVEKTSDKPFAFV